MIKNVTFFGYSQCNPGDQLFETTRSTAKLLAQNGYIIVNGGGPGVMLASTLGAKEANGQTISSVFKDSKMTFFEGRSTDNRTDQVFEFDNYIDRTQKLVDLGDAFVIFNGGTGTLSELGLVWGLARLYHGTHKPLLFYGSFWHDIIEHVAKNMLLRPEELDVYTIIDSPQEALTYLKNFPHEHSSANS
jgi:uncharacterized protein (TIGR00730 family)